MDAGIYSPNSVGRVTLPPPRLPMGSTVEAFDGDTSVDELRFRSRARSRDAVWEIMIGAGGGGFGAGGVGAARERPASNPPMMDAPAVMNGAAAAERRKAMSHHQENGSNTSEFRTTTDIGRFLPA